MEPSEIDVMAPEWSGSHSLLGAHLHQDLYDIHGGPWEAVLDFGRLGTPQERTNAARGLRRLLTEFRDEDRLIAATRRLGMQYVPTNDGYSSYRTWLTAVADYFEDPDRSADEPARDAPYPSWRWDKH